MEDKKKAPAALPSWDQVCCLGDVENFRKAPKVNASFSRSLSLSLDKSAKLEACIRGQIESQSFSLWVLTSIFEFLKKSNCVPESSVFHQLVLSMTDSINAQDKASSSSAAFLWQKRREALVSRLPPHTHDLVKISLLSTPSSSSLFSKDVINPFAPV